MLLDLGKQTSFSSKVVFILSLNLFFPVFVHFFIKV